MFDADFITAITDNSQATAVSINGKTYSTKPVFNPPLPEEPAFPHVPLVSLDSMIEYIKENRDTVELKGAQLWAFDNAVKLVGPPHGEHRRRDTYAIATSGVSIPAFGEYKALEDFRIWLLTCFEGNVIGHREDILKFVARISDNVVKTSEDDGVSQSLTIKSGIASHTEAKVPSPVSLRPIRTFAEVEQPEGLFLFRMQQVKDTLPKAALFELNNNWKREAAILVKEYLDDAQGEIFSEGQFIPVFA